MIAISRSLWPCVSNAFVPDEIGHSHAAAKARGSIVLVDGERLSDLMIDHGVGVTHKALTVPKADHDYFEEG